MSHGTPKILSAALLTISLSLVLANAGWARSINGNITFVNKNAVYSVSQNGHGLKKLFSQKQYWGKKQRKVYLDYISWSPDGKWLLVRVTKWGVDAEISKTHYNLISPNGRHVKKLKIPSNYWDYNTQTYATWLPDGSGVSYLSGQSDNLDLINYSLSGKSTKVGTLPTAFDDSPGRGIAASPVSWSPDGTMLVYSGGGTPGLSLYDQSTGQITHIASDTDYNTDYNPVWSPDGKRIAFNCHLDNICVVNPDGSDRVDLKAGLGLDELGYGFAWSPDSSKIVFSTLKKNNEKTQIETIGSDGKNLKVLASADGRSPKPTWQKRQ